MWVLFERGTTGVSSQPIAFAFDIEELKRMVPLEYFRGCQNSSCFPGTDPKTVAFVKWYHATPLDWVDGINWVGVSEAWLTREADFHQARYSYASYWKIQHLASYQPEDNFYSQTDNGCEDGENSNQEEIEEAWKKLRERSENWTKPATLIDAELMKENEFDIDENENPVTLTYYNGEAFTL